MRVLILTTRHHARDMGASLITAHHRSTPEVTFYWPETNRDRLRGVHWDMVIRLDDFPMDNQLGEFILALCRPGTIRIGF
jgi:hypothetical protein